MRWCAGLRRPTGHWQVYGGVRENIFPLPSRPSNLPTPTIAVAHLLAGEVGSTCS